MRWMTRRARGTTRKARVLVLALAAALTYGLVMLIPAHVGAAAATRQALALTAPRAAVTSGAATAFGGAPAARALFTVSSGQLGAPFCTASVVHSAHGDLAVTAAHCVTGVDGQIAFVPGYASGKQPYGTWPVTAVYTDQAWQSSQDPDHDVAFLRLSGKAGKPIESVTGAERLGIGSKGPPVRRGTRLPPPPRPAGPRGHLGPP